MVPGMPISLRARRLAPLLAVAGLTVAGVSACDSDTPPVGSNPRQVSVVGVGDVQGAPDTLIAEVGIEFVAPDVTGAMNSSNERQQAVIDALVDNGVDRKDIATTQVGLQPQYTDSSSSSSATITGYRASNSLRVTIKKLDTASRVLAIIVHTGGDATRISSVGYTIDDDSELIKAARTRAFEDARARAEQYAQMSGLKLGKVISISESAASSGGAVTRAPAPMPRAMASDVPLEPGQQTVSFSVSAVWELD